MRSLLDSLKFLVNYLEKPNDTCGLLLRQHYVSAIVAALRGPDFGLEAWCERLKALTISRVRAKFAGTSYGDGGCGGHGFAYMHDTRTSWEIAARPLSDEHIREREDLLTKAKDEGYAHFVDHYYQAVEAVKAIYGWNLYDETPWVA